MLKKLGIRKMMVTTSALIIITLLYFFPSNTTTINKPAKIMYENDNKVNVFLLDNYNYVSLVSLNSNEKKELNKIKESINILTENGKEKLPNNFKALIPKNTKIKSVIVEEGLCTINFSKELLNVSNKYKDKMYESIIYTLTQFESINKVKILVEGKELSEKEYSGVVDRTIGINKEYDIDNFKNMTSTTIYYLNNTNNNLYYTPVTKITNDAREKVEIIVSELKSSLIYQSNLSSYLDTNAELKDYEIKEKAIHLTFNDKLFDDFESKKLLEEVKYTLSMSIKDNYEIDKVIFYVNNEEIAQTVLKTLEN